MATAAAPKAKAKATAPKKKPSSPSHPPFYDMISDAIVTLKERTGSSQYAIQKFIEDKHKHLPTTFRKLLLLQLKRCVAAGKLVKVKNSFKLGSSPKAKAPASKTLKPKAAAAEKLKKAAAGSKRKAPEKPKAKTAVAKPKTAKLAKTATKASPGKKTVKPKKVVVKKPKSVKSLARMSKK